MSFIEIAVVFILILSVVASVMSFWAFVTARVVLAKVSMLESAPVLRQYVERFVPIDNSEEAQKRVQQKMQEMEAQFEKSLMTTGGNKKRNKFAENNILRAEELV